MCSSVSSSSRPRNSRPRRRSFTVRNTLTVNGGLGERARIGKTVGGRESIDLFGAMLVDFEGFGKPGIRSMLFNESGGLVLGLVRYLCLPMISLAWVIEANTRPWVAVCSFVKLNLRLKLNLKLSLKLRLELTSSTSREEEVCSPQSSSSFFRSNCGGWKGLRRREKGKFFRSRTSAAAAVALGE